MKMEKLPDLMDEAKDRTIVYLFLIAALAYILSLTSNSVWFNIPVSILIISILRHFHLEFKLQWRMVPIHQESYHSHLKIRRPSHSDPILSSPSISKKWKRKIDSPVVAAAVHKFTLKIVQEFITDLWYSSLTPDQEFPDKICLLINDVLGEVAQRLKHINLIELLTRDVVNLIGSHIELYRRNQAYIGVDVMANLSPNERDERLKHFLASSRELHPALISADTECKVLQQLMGGVVAVVLRPHDAKCPIARSLARELLACVVMQPIMDFASPIFINELIEFLILSAKEEAPNKKTDTDESEELSKGKKISKQHQLNQLKDMPNCGIDLMDPSSIVYLKDINAAQTNNYPKKGLGSSQNDGLLVSQIEVLHDPKSQSGDLEKSMEAKKRTQILASENLDNLWAQGWNYELKDSRKGQYSSGSLVRSPVSQKDSKCVLKKDKAVKENDSIEQGNTERATATNTFYTEGDAKCTDRGKQGPISGTMQSSNQREHQGMNPSKRILLTNTTSALDSGSEKKEESRFPETQILKVQHRRSKSTGTESEQRQNFNILQLSKDGESSLPENTQGLRRGELHDSFHRDNQSATLWRPIGNIFVRKLDCWVLGVHFEKVGMKSIAVYSIAVTNSENKTWFVDRRYRNFEQLHRRLRVIPNYKLQIPPKSFISSNLDDFFIRQRCILLDKYLKDLLSIPNIAEQHEVWDFLSATSKNYAFGKSTSVMKTLAYNMDDAMVDIFRQFKGVSSGLRHTIVGTSSAEKQDLVNASWKSKTANMKDSTWDRIYRSNYLLDEEEHAGEGGRVTHFMERTNGCLSDSELHEEHFASQSNTTLGVSSAASILEKTQQSQKTSEALLLDEYSTAESLTGSEMIEDEVGVPPEWTPPKLCVPLLNLVDKVFQLNQRGWLRRQIFWIGKQILHLVMEDAIDEWLLGQIQLLRREDVIASYIRQVHEVLLDKAIFTSEHSVQQQKENERTSSSSDGAVDGEVIQINTNPPELFQNQLEADRRANLVHDVILGAPAPLVSIIGRKQYNRCAEDLYFFLQSTVCLKQLAYSLLELLLITIFPELHDVVWHIRNNSVLL